MASPPTVAAMPEEHRMASFAVADATARNASLVALDLRRVRFGPAAARATAAALAKNTTLESLYLDGNDIGADECASLLRALDASRLARLARLDERDDVLTEPKRSSLKSVSLVGARTQDAASAARALGERRFLAEGGGKKPKKGKKGENTAFLETRGGGTERGLARRVQDESPFDVVARETEARGGETSFW